MFHVSVFNVDSVESLSLQDIRRGLEDWLNSEVPGEFLTGYPAPWNARWFMAISKTDDR